MNGPSRNPNANGMRLPCSSCRPYQDGECTGWLDRANPDPDAPRTCWSYERIADTPMQPGADGVPEVAGTPGNEK